MTCHILYEDIFVLHVVWIKMHLSLFIFTIYFFFVPFQSDHAVSLSFPNAYYNSPIVSQLSVHEHVVY